MGNGQLNPANYEISKTRKYKNDICLLYTSDAADEMRTV